MSTKTDLYTQDFYAWTQEQVALLREGKWHEFDCEHLREEIEDLGRSARKELRSYLEGLVLHLLKWRYQPDCQTRSWQDSIVENRARSCLGCFRSAIRMPGAKPPGRHACPWPPSQRRVPGRWSRSSMPPSGLTPNPGTRVTGCGQND